MSSRDAIQLLEELQARYSDVAKIVGEGTQQVLLVEAGGMLELFEELKTNESYQFNMLRNLTAVDYTDYLEMVYHFYSFPNRRAITVKVRCDIQDPQVSSVTAIWPSADFQEREIYDLLGVQFQGHPDLRRILLPEDFSGHPLRKTYEMKNTREKR
ncbi:NADH-quinone oxidoreductase subunit C [Anaerosinus massiliensis]|uniref:NADH-quinone oxidoreductase subunit C n=1 Tax=Massilibacillus massiliensis TaxID=1806837 RepID=UPI000A5F87AE|nr:NADH-quinone oxidoreductase subunit C [Massilibacillus massiliensis]